MCKGYVWWNVYLLLRGDVSIYNSICPRLVKAVLFINSKSCLHRICKIIQKHATVLSFVQLHCSSMFWPWRCPLIKLHLLRPTEHWDFVNRVYLCLLITVVWEQAWQHGGRGIQRQKKSSASKGHPKLDMLCLLRVEAGHCTRVAIYVPLGKVPTSTLHCMGCLHRSL